MARFFGNKGRFEELKRNYPRYGTETDKTQSNLANSLRGKTLSVIRLDGNSIETSSNYVEIIENARRYIRADHGSVFAVVFMLDGELYACIESEGGNTPSTHVEIDTTYNLETVCDAVYDGEGTTLMF